MTQLLSHFQAVYGRPATLLARAPGRVNLIGEHTDYNDGYVLPAAIERETCIAAAPRPDGIVRLVARDLDRETTFDLAHVAPAADPQATWSNYVRGVAAGLLAAGYRLRGLDAVIQGNVPVGSGLSSSAALEMASVQAFAAAGEFTVPPDQAARIGQKAEHDFVGANTGLMDQLASALGQPDRVLLIDCRDLSYRPVPTPAGATILIADTAVRRQLASSAYNERRSQCEAAAAAMGVRALRDANLEMLARVDVPDVVRRRAQHVIEENDRVLATVAALQAGDLTQVGRLMNASHASLRDLYEVSSAELDAMAELLRSQPGCYGARLTGAGFGGCCVALVDAPAVDAAIAAVSAAYSAQTGLTPALYPTRAAQGARVELL
ncbi:MAG: Galactokinase [Chloroflexi bacterium ADurb.Bin325]|nr:MAG: Galactokinase [Chloroflexi bacterium ADurb.Bin325]